MNASRKFYEGCELIIDCPTAAKFDELAVRNAIEKILPGISVSFRRQSNTQILEAAEATVPHQHSMAGAAEHDPASSQWIPTGARTILTMAHEVLMPFNEDLLSR
jgi:hypothetical protein